MKKIWLIGILLSALFTGCKDTDAIEADISELQGRVTALEKDVKLLNEQLQAIRELSHTGMTISAIEYNKKDGTYKLTLNEGTVLTLAEKVPGLGTVPLVGIDADGNWQVSYDNGATYAPIKQGDKPVKAKGEDGVTPLFRVSADGYWEISMDGTTYTRVLNEHGQPVRAEASSGDSDLFKSVTVKDDVFVLVLKDGTTISTPIVKSFFCYFDKKYTGMQQVAKGKSAVFNLHLKGADDVMVSVPAGWKYELAAPNASDIAELTLTAPAAGTTSTRAVADNTKDVSVLAVAGMYACLAKIQVTTEGGGTPTPPDPPVPPVPPVTVDGLQPEITASTTFENVGGYSTTNNKLADMTTDGWFFREAGSTTTLSVDATEPAFKATVAGTKGSWNKSSFGYHSTATYERTSKYKLTFQAKSDVAGSVGVAIRDGKDKRGFRLIKSDGTTNWERNVTTPGTKTDWNEVSLIFDFGYASTAMSSTVATYNGGEGETTDEDVKQINIYIYNNQANSTLYVKNLKLEKFTP